MREGVGEGPWSQSEGTVSCVRAGVGGIKSEGPGVVGRRQFRRVVR